MKYIYACLYRFLLFCGMLLLVPTVHAQQVKGNQYIEDFSSVEITHKPAKWFDLRKNISESAKAMDSFNDDWAMFTLQDGQTQVQATHTYMDTIYVHKGTSVQLEVPDKLNDNMGVQSYQRWYSFRTDATFRTNNTEANEVWDLLTPNVPTPDGITEVYRYANGYVGQPKGDNLFKVKFYVPTDAEFQAWFGEEAVNKYDNNYFLVACDVSSYTDYTKNYSDNSSSSTFVPSGDGKTYEPTLTHRVLFYIVTVDNRDTDPTFTWKNSMGRLKSEEYQGGTLEEGKKYLEEYDISFPATRVSNYTSELVVLSKDAWSYAIPDAIDDHNTLDLHLVDHGSGITLKDTKLTGMSRIIQFNYPNKNYDDGTQYVHANNSSATIYVTKRVKNAKGQYVTYNIARFNLTFIRDTRLLTQTQIKQIEEGTIADERLKYYQFRTNPYLEKNYQLLTSLDFDYDPAVAELYGLPEFYTFPMAWTSNSYSFYDGSEGRDFINNNKYPEWGYYAIMKTFMEADHWTNGTKNNHAAPLPGSTYHLYIDASDRPGVIARLPFDRKLCKGSELFVTAWLKSAGWDSESNDANMLFSVMGVKTDPVLGTVYEPIYRHSSSQVRRTDYLSGMPGTGSDTNEWMQMYFSFILDEDAEYDSYVLQIDNNSASTNGGDMYIDDIRVYIATPSAEVKQLNATCTEDRTLMSIKLDLERLLSRLGEVEGEKKIDAIDFCFIDKVKYYDFLNVHPGDFLGAIEASVVDVGDNKPGGYNQKFNTLYFNVDFDQNTNYDDRPHPRLAIDNEGTGEYAGKYFFYRTEDESGKKALAVDFYSDLTPNRAYMMLIQVNDGNPASADDFKESIDDACGINTSFYVTAETLIRVNGEIVDPFTDFCAGQIFNFSAQLRVPKQEADGSESYVTIDHGVYFDWFFGSEDEFLAEHPEYGNESLQNALIVFRELYPYNVDLTGVVCGEPVEGKIVFTQNMYDLIRHYLESVDEEGLHPSLVLHQENLNVTLLKSGLKLVFQPIPTLLPPDGTIDEESWARVCWGYVPLELQVSGDAPQLHAGFNSVKYPSEDFNPCLRIGLKQLMSTEYAKPIKVNLRGAKLVSEGAKYIGMITSVSPEIYNKLYLIRTDDPAYLNDTYFPEDFSEYSLPIGTLKSLHAEVYDDGSSFADFMEIYFDTETEQENGFRFQPKEGYTYTFTVRFEEHGDQAFNTCFGNLTIEMKVVPEYLVWNGTGAIANWNNDANWKRADKDELRKDPSDTYLTNDENTTGNGFVPMLFSNVIMPQGSQVELYMAGYGEGGNGWVNSQRPSYMEQPTPNIQYDLMAYENSDGAFSTERYRVNLCRDIHFETDAQMLRAEQLIYRRVWTDVALNSGSWTALSSPLQGMVAGDWYTSALNGRQETEYFKDIMFQEGVNNRLNPAVYQRSWGTGATIVEKRLPNTPVSFNATDWSSAYNDAGVSYKVGNGFSLKPVSANASLLFRFPKSDSSYPVSTGNGMIDRTKIGRLQISDMVDRTNPYEYIHSDRIEVSLTPSADSSYFMIGNPFLAPLDVQEFLTENSAVLQQKYWLTPDVSAQPAAVYDSGTGTWTASPYLLPPYSVFYAEAVKPVADAETVVAFTAEMQKFERDINNGDGGSGKTLRITARNAVGQSFATLCYSNTASDALGKEDAVLLQTVASSDIRIPIVYTVAGEKAASVNLVRNAQKIPLGIFGVNVGMTDLIFEGTDGFRNISLYDAHTQEMIPLYEGFVLSVSGESHGRYFIVYETDGTTGISVIDGKDDVNVCSVVPNQLIVTSNSDIQEVSVYTLDGVEIRTQNCEGGICTMERIGSGPKIVKIKRGHDFVVRKITVK